MDASHRPVISRPQSFFRGVRTAGGKALDEEEKLLKLAAKLFRAGNFDDIAKRCRAHLSKDADSVGANLMLITALAAQNSYEECIKRVAVLDRNLSVLDQEAIYGIWQCIFPLMGFCFQRLRQYEEAINILNRVEKLNSFSFTVRGISKFEIKDFKGSLDDFMEVYKISPDDFWCLFYLGRLARVFDNPEKAFVYFGQAEKLNHKSRELVLFERAKLYQQIDNIPAAIIDCENVCRLNPRDEASQDFLVELLVLADRFDEARELALSGLAHNQSDEYVLFCIACLAGTGGLQEAIQLFSGYQKKFDERWAKYSIFTIEECYNIWLKRRTPIQSNVIRELTRSIGVPPVFNDEEQQKFDEMKTFAQSFDSLIAEIPNEIRLDAVALIETVIAKAKSGNGDLIASLLGSVKDETFHRLPSVSCSERTIIGESSTLSVRPYALPPGTPPPIPPSRRHVADLSPAEHEARKKKERLKKAAQAAKRAQARQP